MARMHSRDKGRSGSTQPSKKSSPTWLQYKPKEVELLIVKYAKEGKSPSQIGTYLRDEYGIPDVKLVTGKSVSSVLRDKKLLGDIPEDLMALIRKAILLRKHLGVNHKDQPGRRGLRLTESKIMRLAKYYKGTGRLPASWKYDPEKVKLTVE
ncbi:30S ribosomal protein S15 [Candidatus Woesearchaeota archaeon]|nr:30S ribosomal protein S15 [Candidatus Woesearchaeota archaeon]